MKGFLSHVSTVLVTLLLISDLAWAQATAQLNGRVSDESGAVLPECHGDANRHRVHAFRGDGRKRGLGHAEPADRAARLEIALQDFAPTPRPASCCRSTAAR